MTLGHADTRQWILSNELENEMAVTIVQNQYLYTAYRYNDLIYTEWVHTVGDRSDGHMVYLLSIESTDIPLLSFYHLCHEKHLFV